MHARKASLFIDTNVSFWKLTLLTVAVLLNFILACRLAWGSHSIAAYRALVFRFQSITEELKTHRADIERLSCEIRLLQSSPEHIEKMIRQRLNFVKDNEILYIFTHKNI